MRATAYIVFFLFVLMLLVFQDNFHSLETASISNLFLYSFPVLMVRTVFLSLYLVLIMSPESREWTGVLLHKLYKLPPYFSVTSLKKNGTTSHETKNNVIYNFVDIITLSYMDDSKVIALNAFQTGY